MGSGDSSFKEKFHLQSKMTEGTEETKTNVEVVKSPSQPPDFGVTEACEESATEKCETNSQFEVKKPKPAAKVARSLSDEEYDAIFTAVVERAMNTPLDESSLPKPKSPKRKGSPKKNKPAFKVEPTKGKAPPKATKPIVPVKKVVPLNKPAENPLKRKITNDADKGIKVNKPAEPTKPKLGKPTKPKLAVPTKQKLAEPTKSTAKVSPIAEPTKPTRKVSSKELMENREVEQIGIWVQCSITSCNKWRNLTNIHDPTTLAENWNCSMNPDSEQNTCDAKEAEFDPETEHEDFIYTKFAEGSLVWARIPGYPWWPGLVEVDPDFQMFFECKEQPNIASHYHVSFLDVKVSRAWLGVKSLRPYTGEETNMGPTKFRGVDHRKELTGAKKIADSALKLNIPNRIAQYGFTNRFKGKWGKHQELVEVQGTEKTDESQSELAVVDDFAGLSGEEVDEILDNAESIIESAHETLNELLSSNSQVLDEFIADEPPKKKPKKEKAKKAKQEGDDKPKSKKKKQTDPVNTADQNNSVNTKPKAEKSPGISKKPKLSEPANHVPPTKKSTDNKDKDENTKKMDAKPVTGTKEKSKVTATSETKKPVFSVQKKAKPKFAAPKVSKAPKVEEPKKDDNSKSKSSNEEVKAFETKPDNDGENNAPASNDDDNFLDLVIDIDAKPTEPSESASVAVADVMPETANKAATTTEAQSDAESEGFED